MKTYIIIPKFVLFVIFVFGLYIATVPLLFPSLLGIGEIRVVAVAALSWVFEELFFYYFAKAVSGGEVMERKTKARAT